MKQVLVTTLATIIAMLLSLQMNAQISWDTTHYSSTYQPHLLSYGDFNNDNHEDILISYHYNAKMGILLNNGDGTFGNIIYITTASYPQEPVIADFDNDGKLDFASSHSSGTNSGHIVTVHLGNGNGTFQTYSSYTVYGSYTYFVDAGDLNNDNYLDLVISSAGWDGFSILINDGDGTFTAGNHYSSGQEGNTIKLADFNGDNKLDVALSAVRSYRVEIFMGNGNATFNSSTLYNSPISSTKPYIKAVTDIDNDNDIDIIVNVTKTNNRNLYIMRNNGSGVFTYEFVEGGGYTDAKIVDWNNDGYIDIVDNKYDDNISKYTGATVFLNDSSGGFANKIVLKSGEAKTGRYYPKDLNGDNLIDLALPNFDSSRVEVSLQQPPNYFITEIHNLNDNLVPTGWTFNEELANADIANGKLNAYQVDANGQLIRDGIMPSATDSVIIEWDGDFKASGWGRITGIYINFKDSFKYSLSSTVNNTYHGNNTVYRIQLDTLASLLAGTDIIPNTFCSYDLQAYHFTAIITDDSIYYKANRNSDNYTLFDTCFNAKDAHPQFSIQDISKITFICHTTTTNDNWLDNPSIRIVLQTQPQYTDTSLVAHYPFNGNANDASGNGNNGTVNGNVQLTYDRFGNANSAYEFPGVAFNYISVPHSQTLALDTFTISAWIYSDTDYGYGRIVQKGRDIYSGHIGLYTVYVNTTISSGNGVVTPPVNEPSIGTWHLITGSISGNNAKYYVDGQLIKDSITPNTFSVSSTETLSIGMHYFNEIPSSWTYPYKGKIDDIRIFNRELNEIEIDSIYHIGGWPLQQPSCLVADYKFSGNAADSSGNTNHGTVNGATLTTDRFGKANSAYSFDGVDDWIVCPNANVTNEFTISTWIKTFSSPNESVLIIEQHDGGTNNGFFLGTAKDTIISRNTFSNEKLFNEWTHVVYVANNGTEKLYRNGVLLIENTSAPILGYSSQQLYIGNDNIHEYDFKGDIDDIQIYNCALDSAAIDSLYHIGGWPLQQPSCLVADYKFSGNANDESGNGNHGTVNGATLTTDRFGNVNSAYSFDGVDDYIKVIDNPILNISNQITISSWFSFKQGGTQNPRVISKCIGTQYSYELYTYSTNSTRKIAINFKSDASLVYELVSSQYLIENKTYYVVATYDGTSIKLYINGELDTSRTDNFIINQTTSNLYYGSKAGTDDIFKGKIDDIQIYNCALDSTAIDSLYHIGGWPFILSSSITYINNNCFQGQMASIIIDSVQGSVGSLNYQWSTGDTTANIDSLSSGWYFVSITDANNNSIIDSVEITEPDQISVSINNSLQTAYCQSDADFSLNAIPYGGVFSGLGITDSTFSPALTASGTHQIIYSYTNANACTNSDTVSITVIPNPIVSILSQLNAQYCSNENSIIIAAYPQNGTFSGTVITGNIFNPALAAVGQNQIIYTFTNTNGCTNTDTISTEIIATPIVNISTNLNTDYCSDTSPINLSATPYGGVFIGNGITDSIFSPAQAGVGVQQIIYSYANANGCSSSDTVSTVINTVPNVYFTSTLDTSYCQNQSMINLSASPIGGNLLDNGNALNGNPFTVIGNHEFIYSFTTTEGCSSSDTLITNIKILPNVNFTTLNDVCGDAQSVSVANASPTGGIYQGANTTAQGMFYPQSAASGTYAISYIYTDANGCTDTAIQTQRVVSMPTANFSIAATVCHNQDANITFTGQSGVNATYNWNFGGGQISSGTTSGPYAVQWSNIGLAQVSLEVTDSGCVSPLETNYTNVLSGFAMVTIVGIPTACYGDSVTLFVNTGLNFSYQWYDANGILASNTASYINISQSGDYYCMVSAPYTCPTFSDTVNVNIKLEIIPNFSITSTACLGNMVAVNFTGTAPLGANYIWDFDSGTIASGSGAGPYNIIWNSDSNRVVGLTVSEGNCSSLLNEQFISIEQTTAIITALGNTEICQGNNVTLSANVGTYTYQWIKDGINTSGTSALYNISQSGSYQVEVSDVNTNCSSVSDSIIINVNNTDFNISFTANPVNFNIPPFNTVFTNQTSNANDYYWTWNFGDGNTSSLASPPHQYLFDGDYTVEAIAQNITTSCFDTLIKTNYISCSGGSANPCSLDATVGSYGIHQICPIDTIKLWSTDHTSGIIYQWLRDGILLAGATDSVYYANTSGLYQLLLSDTSCSVFSQPYSLTHFTTVIPSILSNGNIQPCTNDSLELYVSTSYNSYQWSSGEVLPSIFTNTSGSFIVTVTDNNGCNTSSTPYVVNASLLQVPNICIVGIDSATNHNRVIWERENGAMIDSFKIYRESTVAGVYNLIGSQPFATQSVFEDVNSIPAQQAYRYRITAVDTCGMETAPSPIHKTLHLTINAGLGGVWNLIWTNYEGFNFGSYRIYRGVDSLDIQLLTQIQSTMTSYTDLNPPTGNVYYQIEVVSPHPCYPDSIYSKVNTNYNTSRSNTANSSMAPNIGFVQSSNKGLLMQIYPNPNNGNFTLEISNNKVNKNQRYNIKIYSTLGKLVYQEEVKVNTNLQKTINLESLSSGVYFIRLRTDDEVLNGRFVVE